MEPEPGDEFISAVGTAIGYMIFYGVALLLILRGFWCARRIHAALVSILTELKQIHQHSENTVRWLRYQNERQDGPIIRPEEPESR